MRFVLFPRVRLESSSNQCFLLHTCMNRCHWCQKTRPPVNQIPLHSQSSRLQAFTWPMGIQCECFTFQFIALVFQDIKTLIRLLIGWREFIFGANIWKIVFCLCVHRLYSSAMKKSLSGDFPQEDIREANRRSVQRGHSDEVPNTSTSQVLRRHPIKRSSHNLQRFIAEYFELSTLFVFCLCFTGIIRNDIYGEWLWCGWLPSDGGSWQSRFHAQT